MSVIVDTDLVARHERASLISDTLVYASAPSDVIHEDARAAWARMSVVPLGKARNTFTQRGSGVLLQRRPRHVRTGASDRVAFAVQGPAAGGKQVADNWVTLGHRELFLMDLTGPYKYFWTGDGGADCFQVGCEQLGVPLDVVRGAAHRLTASPLYGLVRDHIVQLCRDAERIDAQDEAAAAGVGAATTALLRALILTATEDGGVSYKEALAATLADRVAHHLRRHWADQDLSVSQMAGVLGVSVPELRQAWSLTGPDTDIEEWVIQRRLDAAAASIPETGTFK